MTPEREERLSTEDRLTLAVDYHGQGLYGAAVRQARQVVEARPDFADARFLLAASALWIGWSSLIPFLLYTAIAGGGLALLVIIWRRIGHESDLRGVVWFRNLFNKQIKVPYGVAIAIGGIVAFSETWWVKSMV